MAIHSPDLARHDVEKAYRLWSGIYDATCGPLFAPAHRAMAKAVNQAAESRGGADVLEVGVGTGLLFGLYGSSTRVTGIDISPQMLAKARERLEGGHYPQIVALDQADVHALPYADGRFDVVTFPFVITLVNSPETALAEAARVLRPGGQIMIVSHFRSEGPIGRSIETALAPFCARMGLRPDFPLARIEGWAAKAGGVTFTESRRIAPLSPFTLVRLTA
jgi:phosphatidylethanolamine/phosphatidyl-N-methylethanolamine N-methyltransferase